MEVKEVLNCSFQNWYNDFKHLTIKSIFIPLPDGFKEYLLADGVVLPNYENDLLKHSDNNKSDNEDWESSDDDDVTIQAPKFLEFDSKIKNAIQNLGGKVFPKLNWTSPRDASWIALNNSCCCSSVSDIYLLLKSSDFISQDITHPFLHCVDHETEASSFLSNDVPLFLVLRKWKEINPDTEFRCFVNDNTLIGISQRDLSVFSGYNLSHKSKIIEDLLFFFTENIQFRFSSASYVLDVVRMKEGSVFLLDFGPFGEVTNPLLFDWSEVKNGKILSGNNLLPVYRCPTHNCGIQPSSISHSALPKDIVDITSGDDSFKFADLLKLMARQTADLSSDDDD